MLVGWRVNIFFCLCVGSFCMLPYSFIWHPRVVLFLHNCQCVKTQPLYHLDWIRITYYQDFFPYSYMIDNIILLITGTLHQRPISELVPKCHKLGSFEQMEAIHVAATPAELYNAVLVGKLFSKVTSDVLKLFWPNYLPKDKDLWLQMDGIVTKCCCFQKCLL